MKTDEKKLLIKAGIAWGGCALLLAVLYMFVLFPARRKAKQVRAGVDEITAEYNQAMEFVTGKFLDRMRWQVASLQEELDKHLVLYDEARTTAFRVSQIAEEAGVKGFSTKHRTGKTVDAIDNCLQIGVTRINITFNGRYRQLAALINQFERHRPVVLVDRFAIERSGKKNELHDISIGLSILVDKSKTTRPVAKGILPES